MGRDRKLEKYPEGFLDYFEKLDQRSYTYLLVGKTNRVELMTETAYLFRLKNGQD